MLPDPQLIPYGVSGEFVMAPSPRTDTPFL
jgi:hypothetical protein